VDSAAIIDGSVGAVDVANSLVHDMVAKTAPVGADTILINDSEAGNINKKATLTNVANTLAGTPAITGLSNTAGVLTAAIKIAHLVADEKSSLVFEGPTEVDFGVATAVDEKITDSAGAKGKLLIAIGIVTEAFNGDADNTISVSNNTLLVDDVTRLFRSGHKDAAATGNWLGALFGGHRVAGADNTVASGADIYAYSAANANRSAGKMVFLLIFQKTA
jgi:hypothetical protein